MPNKRQLAKLTKLSNRGKVSLNEAEVYLAKKGWQTGERNEALKYMDKVKKEHASKKPNHQKSGIVVYIIILIIIVGILAYFSFSGIINFK